MKIVCISAANIKGASHHSASTHVCEIIKQHGLKRFASMEVEILPLVEKHLIPCNMCGACFNTGVCIQRDDFNRIFETMSAADAIFIVCPHYTPIPAKLVMILEKLEEMFFLEVCADADYHFPLAGKPVGIIAHGGQEDSDQVRQNYNTALLEPLSTALASIQMAVVGLHGEPAKGLSFGIKSIFKKPDSIFVSIEHDWAAIKERIIPLVDEVIIQVHGG